MYSVIKTSGFQYKVAAGQILRLPLVQADLGSTLTFDQVLLASDGSSVNVGQPVVAGAKVTAEVLVHGQERKIMVFRRKRRKGFRRLRGHRQQFTEVVITTVEAAGKSEAADANRIEFARKRAKAFIVRHTPAPRPLTRKEKVAAGPKA
ncbi:MAG: 50S ribosomal protein L21 [Fibrobacteria bacterium]|nr:50S ribosomal protein L21 [Fibrobacteria bacterium]